MVFLLTYITVVIETMKVLPIPYIYMCIIPMIAYLTLMNYDNINHRMKRRGRRQEKIVNIYIYIYTSRTRPGVARFLIVYQLLFINYSYYLFCITKYLYLIFS